MVHVAIGKATGGQGATGIAITFTPGAGDYAGTSLSVLVTVTGAPQLQWKIGSSGSYTTVAATSTTVTVPLTLAGKTLYVNALNSGGTVVGSNSAFYSKNTGGN